MEERQRRKRTKTSTFGSPGREGHDSTIFYNSKLYNNLPGEKRIDYVENPIPPEHLNKIFPVSSENMKELPDSSVHLMVTSPPYNTGKDYDNDLSLDEYLSFLEHVLKEVKRVLVPSGRACINIANLGRKPYIPLHSFIINIMIKLGFLMRGEIIWDKSASAGTSTAWGCYDEKTRVLTDNGLKLFKDVNISSDRFMTLNVKNNAIEYQKAFNYIEKKFKGEMYEVKSKNFDLLLTPNHNVLYMPLNYIHSKTNSKFMIKPIEELAKYSQFYIPKTIETNYELGRNSEYYIIPNTTYGKRTKKEYMERDSLKIEMNSWMKFLGIFLTDGSVYFSPQNRQYKVSIFQKKRNFLKEIHELLETLPFNFKYKKSKSEYYVCNKRLTAHLAEFKGKDKLLFPTFIHSLTVPQKKLFLDWLFKGDGSYTKDGSLRYFATTSINFRDNLFHLLTHLGYNFSYYRQNGKYSWSKDPQPIYRINLKKSDYYFLRKENISKIPYNGKIYCVSVPNKVLFVERKGKFTWCGNSWMSPSNPTLRDVHEYILVFSKEKYKRISQVERKSSITRDEFLELTKSVWKFPTESAKKIGHPAPFPIELPYRLIQLYSHEKEVILDPFIGSGQTAIAAIKTNRYYIGYEIEVDYVKLAEKRIREFEKIFKAPRLTEFLD